MLNEQYSIAAQPFTQTQSFELCTALSLLACDLKGITWSSTDGSVSCLLRAGVRREDKLRKEMSVLLSGMTSHPMG